MLTQLRQAAIDEAYEAQWDGGKGSHHPDYDPYAGGGAHKATRETEELLNAVIKARSRGAGARGGVTARLPASGRVAEPPGLARTTCAWCTRRWKRAAT